MNRKYVLRKHGINPSQSQIFVAYMETLHSVPIDIFGVEACTIFTEHSTTRDRAVRLGWKDETLAYNEYQKQLNNKLKKAKEEHDKLLEDEEIKKTSNTSKSSKSVKKATKTRSKKISTSTKTR